MASNRTRSEEARLKAHEKFAKAEKREKEAVRERDKAFAAAVSKTARLRALRLAKEAADKEAADKKAAETKSAKRAPSNGP